MNARTEQPSLLVVEESRARRQDPAALPLVAQSGNANSLLAAITTATSNQRLDMNQVERLFAMHQTIKRQEAEEAFNAAMARTQALIQPIVARSWNDQTKSHYAKLEAIDRVITPIHTAEGISISYDTETKNDADPIPPGMIRILGWVRHSGGHKERIHIDLPTDDVGAQGNRNKTKVQGICSTNTYGRRFLKLMAFNVSTFDDKDGNGARGKRATEERTDGAGERAEPGGKIEYPAKEFLKNLPQWKELMETKKRTPDQIIATAESKYTLSEGQKQRIRSAAGSK